jgi:hypothetical protein
MSSAFVHAKAAVPGAVVGGQLAIAGRVPNHLGPDAPPGPALGFADTVKHYLFIQDVGDRAGDHLAPGRAGFHELLADVVTGQGTLEQEDWAWEELFAFVKTATQPPAAVRHGEHIAKIRVARRSTNGG